MVEERPRKLTEGAELGAQLDEVELARVQRAAEPQQELPTFPTGLDVPAPCETAQHRTAVRAQLEAVRVT